MFNMRTRSKSLPLLDKGGSRELPAEDGTVSVLPNTRRRLSIPDVSNKQVQQKDNADPYNLCLSCHNLQLDEFFEAARLEKSPQPQTFKIAGVRRYYRPKSGLNCILCPLITASHRYSVPSDMEIDEIHLCKIERACRDAVATWIPFDLDSSHSLVVLLPVFPNVPSTLPLGKYAEIPYKRFPDRWRQGGLLVARHHGSPLSERPMPVRIPPRVDLMKARSWVHDCAQNHESACLAVVQLTTGISLIDCDTSKIIPAPPGSAYVALSYVWGAPDAHPPTSAGLLSSVLPLVIVDAIHVTLGLGFKYLWVDRFCIDQSSSTKLDQISQMDAIYRNAEVTIVAAAGDGPDYGLPGVSSRQKVDQPLLSLKNIDLFPVMRHPHRTIASTRWYTRAWTFQEAILSRRVLVFTEDQVYFECGQASCCESAASGLKSHGKLSPEIMFGPNNHGYHEKKIIVNDHRHDNHITPYMSLVGQYTARQMTFDKDSLNALAGIIRSFETSRPLFRQIWGVPYWDCPEPQQTTDTLVRGLLWDHPEFTGSQDPQKPPRRRPTFPSWSWCGWAAEAAYGSANVRRPIQNKILSVFIEDADGTILTVQQHASHVRNTSSAKPMPPIIHLQALVVPPSAFSRDRGKGVLRVFDRRAGKEFCSGHWDTDEFVDSLVGDTQGALGARVCIYVGHRPEATRDNDVLLMVLEKRADDAWYRLGLIHARNSTGEMETWTAWEVEALEATHAAGGAPVFRIK